MVPDPVVVEVSVERKGIFVVTTSVIMCNDVYQAQDAFEGQQTMAKGLMEWQWDAIEVKSSETIQQLWRAVNGSKKSK